MTEHDRERGTGSAGVDILGRIRRLVSGGMAEVAWRKWRIVQVALTAGLAWLVATEVFGHDQAFFAPISAVIVLSLTVRQRGRRALELALGVTIGIAIADLIVFLTGTGAWQITVVVALAVTAALFAGGGRILINQAAVSAVLVAALPTPDLAQSLERVLDALVGGGLALIANAVFPVDPVRIGMRRIDPLLTRLAGVLIDVADSLVARNEPDATEALEDARALDPAVRSMKVAVETGRERLRMAPSRRVSRGAVGRFETAAEPIDLIVRDTRVLARGAVRAIALDEHVPDSVPDSIRELSISVRALDRYLGREEGEADCREAALRAAALSTAALEETSNMAASAIVAQVRATSLDLLTGLGIDEAEARAEIHSARETLGI